MSTFLATTMYMDREGLHYRVMEQDKSIAVSFNGLDHLDRMEAKVFFDEDNTSIAIRSWGLCKVPEDKMAKLFETCNELNKRYRWLKFFVDPEAKTVDMAMDAVVNEETSGAVVDELIHRLVNIADEAYPDLMKAIWG